MDRTPPFQGENRGSTPRDFTKELSMRLRASKICASRGHNWAHHTDKKDECLRCGRQKHKRYMPNPHARIDRKEE